MKLKFSTLMLQQVCASVALSYFSVSAFALEPANLATLKQTLKQYHDSGEYEQDIASKITQAQVVLQKAVQKNAAAAKPAKLAIVLDIDETALSNYSRMLELDFGGIKTAFSDGDVGKNPSIAATLKLYQYAKAQQVAVFFVTGRMEDKRTLTTSNLNNTGFKNFDGLLLRAPTDAGVPADIFKPLLRKKIADKGYTIVLNIGDQASDLAGDYSGEKFKLPNPYYHIS